LRVCPLARLRSMPYRFSSFAALEILVITTRGTRSWLVPKGGPIRGLRRDKSAAREAWEEAGVRGRSKSIGSFVHTKMADDMSKSVQ